MSIPTETQRIMCKSPSIEVKVKEFLTFNMFSMRTFLFRKETEFGCRLTEKCKSGTLSYEYNKLIYLTLRLISILV